MKIEEILENVNIQQIITQFADEADRHLQLNQQTCFKYITYEYKFKYSAVKCEYK